MTTEEQQVEQPASYYDPSPIMDTFDIDLVMKVLTNTLFSPAFLAFIPIFYYFQGSRWPSDKIVYSSAWCITMMVFWGVKWYSRLYRNQSKLLWGPGPFDWGNQVVVITGGSSGIGELLANTLAVRNVNVVVLDVKPIVTENYNIAYYKCDVTKPEEVQAVATQVIEEIGHPTVLINNAGVVQGKLLLDLTPEDVRQTFEVNTLSHFWTLKAFLPEMIKQKSGHIITMSSVLGMVGVAQMSDYNASKAALINLHESLRYELDKRYDAPGVRTTLVLPGLTQTPMFSGAFNMPAYSNTFHKFFTPPLQPITVVKSIIAALDEQHSRTIFLPFYAHFVPFVPLLPSFLKDFAKWISGADHAMEGFVKVSGKRASEGVPEKKA